MPTLLDRAPELDRLGRLVDDAATGSGGLVLIEGDAGIGKTGLVQATRELAHRRGVRVLAARGTELEGELAFTTVRQMLSPVVALAPQDGAAALAVPVLASAGPEAPTGRDLFATLHGLYWLTADLARSGPVAVLVDDAQWCDVPSLRFLTYLARRLEGLPVSMLVATRPSTAAPREDLLAALVAEPLADVLRPAPLGETAVRELVATSLGDPDPAFVRACAEATGGNPFLLRELMAALADAATVPTSSAVAGIAGIVPREVDRSIRVRLARFAPEAAAVARAAAVLGDGAGPQILAELAGVDAEQAGRAMDELVTARLLRPSARATFLHPLLRSAVRATIGPAELATAHRRAATLLAAAGEPDDAVVPHLLAARPYGDPVVVEHLRRAAGAAAARGAPDVAARLLTRALAEPPPSDARPALLLELGVAELRAGQGRAAEHLAAAADAMPDPVTRARATLPLARALLHSGRVAEAVQRCTRAIDDLGTGEAAAELAMELEAELVTIASQDPSTRDVAVARHADRVHEPQPDTRAGCLLLASLALEEVYSAGSRERAVDLAEKALTGGHLMAEQLVARLLGVGIALTLSGRPARAVDLWDEAIARARGRGDAQGFAIASAFRGYAAYYTGDLRASLADTRLALELSRETATQMITRGFATSWLTYGLIDTGELANADALLAENAELFQRGVSSVNYLFSARGQLRLAQGRLDEAVADLQECGRRLATSGSHGPAACRWRAPLVLALLGCGETDRARAVAAETVGAARSWGAPYPLAEALRVAGLAEPGDAGLERLRESVAVAAPIPLERIRALVALGGRLRRDGERSAARDPLREAVELALDRGATALARQAQDELVATGARPRRLRTTGVDALTATERRVAAMAADGLTNRAVAQALFVSEKTVETHLGHAYRKLGITARSQLAAAIGEGAAARSQGDERHYTHPAALCDPPEAVR